MQPQLQKVTKCNKMLLFKMKKERKNLEINEEIKIQQKYMEKVKQLSRKQRKKIPHFNNGMSIK